MSIRNYKKGRPVTCRTDEHYKIEEDNSPIPRIWYTLFITEFGPIGDSVVNKGKDLKTFPEIHIHILILFFVFHLTD